MPELPADFRCFHCATSSMFVNSVVVRITPTGLPVHSTNPSFHVHVSGSQFTLTKSFSPIDRQPSPSPSMNALGGAPGSSANPTFAPRINSPQTTPDKRRLSDAVFIPVSLCLRIGGAGSRRAGGDG